MCSDLSPCGVWVRLNSKKSVQIEISPVMFVDQSCRCDLSIRVVAAVHFPPECRLSHTCDACVGLRTLYCWLNSEEFV